MIDNEVKLSTEFIKLDQLLKFSGAVCIGSEAKEFIADGKVKFNGEVCTMRGKKCRKGDVITFENTDITLI